MSAELWVVRGLAATPAGYWCHIATPGRQRCALALRQAFGVRRGRIIAAAPRHRQDAGATSEPRRCAATWAGPEHLCDPSRVAPRVTCASCALGGSTCRGIGTVSAWFWRLLPHARWWAPWAVRA